METAGSTSVVGQDAKKGPLARASSGSATGNPRNKCALQPGHSLMDWIRLGNSGVDLAGNGGQLRPVTRAELAQHNTTKDAWLAIRGMVYNVTRYLDFHPGGKQYLAIRRKWADLHPLTGVLWWQVSRR